MSSGRLGSILLLAATVLGAGRCVAQIVVATVPVGYLPTSAAVNSVTNKTYAANCGTDPSCSSGSVVTVIDGATLATQNVTVGFYAGPTAINPVTNQIFVVNRCGNDPTCSSAGTVTVINGTTLATQTVNVGQSPEAIAVNTNTNKIYVVNSDTTMTVIDGSTLQTQSVPIGAGASNPNTIAINPALNQILVANFCGGSCSGASQGTLTIVNGNNLSTHTVTVGYAPQSVAVDPTTSNIFVANQCGNDPNCASGGTLSVVNGQTLNAQSVAVGTSPYDVAFNLSNNQIYVVNVCGDDPSCSSNGTVTVINGSTLQTATIQVGAQPSQVTVNSVTNKVYVINACGNDPTCQNGIGTITAIDGATNSTSVVGVGDFPTAEGINTATNITYVANNGDSTVSVIANAKLQLVTVNPCRLVDTRQTGNPIQGGTTQSFTIPQLGGCNIPTSAAAYALNVTVVPHGQLGYLTIWPAGQNRPLASTMNSDGRIKANAAIVAAGAAGAVSVYASNTTDVILDISGYFTPSGSQTFEFYPMSPCRVVDTRQGMGQLNGPYLSGGQERDFPVPDSSCIPQNVQIQAYSFNFTVVPHPSGSPLDYLTVWPQGGSKPLVSTLNNPTGTVVANAAIVPAGTAGGIAVYPSRDTDLVIDINGYFAAPGNGGLSLYPTPTCRVIDTRKIGPPFTGELTVNVTGSACALPSAAQGYVFNATVVPDGPLYYLTLWPDTQPQPVVSTLNALDSATTSNMAIVPTVNGSVDAYASGYTQLIIDISSYFAP